MVDSEEFCHADSRRIRTFASSGSAPRVAGAGWDGHVYIWDVEARQRVYDFPTATESGGVSLALSANGSACFVGTYYSWGAACVDLQTRQELWRRPDLTRFYGLEAHPDETAVTAWFDRRAGLTLETLTGRTVDRHIALHGFAASRFNRWTLKYGKQFELIGPDTARRTWRRDGFALLACAFSPDHCVVSEAASTVQAHDLESRGLSWTYQPRPGAHVTALEFSTRLGCFVAVEYAYTDQARAEGPMVSLLRFDSGGRVLFRQAIRDWSDVVLCSDGQLLLNGLGELYDVQTGRVAYVFPDFPR